MIPIEGVQFKRNIRKFLSGQDIGARVKAEGVANKNLASGDREKAVPGEVIPRGQDWGVDAAVGADAIMNLFHPRETTALRVNSKANSELWGVVCRFTACNKRHCDRPC